MVPDPKPPSGTNRKGFRRVPHDENTRAIDRTATLGCAVRTMTPTETLAAANNRSLSRRARRALIMTPATLLDGRSLVRAADPTGAGP